MQNYAANFKSGQRLTGQEANRLGQAADQIANISVAPSDYHVEPRRCEEEAQCRAG